MVSYTTHITQPLHQCVDFFAIRKRAYFVCGENCNMKKIVLLIFVLAFVACQQDTKPPELLPVEEMVKILKEFHLGEGSISQLRLSGDQRTELRDQLYDKLLDKYSIPRETFYSSYEYYLTQPMIMDSIYTHIIDELNHQLPEEQAKRARQ